MSLMTAASMDQNEPQQQDMYKREKAPKQQDSACSLEVVRVFWEM